LRASRQQIPFGRRLRLGCVYRNSTQHRQKFVLTPLAANVSVGSALEINLARRAVHGRGPWASSPKDRVSLRLINSRAIECYYESRQRLRINHLDWPALKQCVPSCECQACAQSINSPVRESRIRAAFGLNVATRPAMLCSLAGPHARGEGPPSETGQFKSSATAYRPPAGISFDE
jgi:hypothetical protein